ncbi:AAA family ATPase [Cyanobium sp. Cruz CV13-4-11]|jgi:stage III sporulation protein SpoIIIAA|uniref:AAA family ATPase n=1 Tax=unclassified Cyanobium TaxID=2627006 RepID=UPI0020CF30BD|nr:MULTISPECIES: AAA family ATPase [unclassified Cyanobium]MCP9901642.1 AAA family ATPase [Cyanobium sp. Cruz CV11-17]MCP9920595.1 AAA family ATPase [Cyanobium sp. Cruz CV13-4-11]
MLPQRVADDLDRLIALLPEPVKRGLAAGGGSEQLLEVVLDLGRPPEARFPGRTIDLDPRPISRDDLAGVISRLGPFGGDNRAGIERTLHRISAIRNRTGDVVGLTCRVGRAVFGTVAMVRDLLDTGQSLLLMGRPGVGKTTALREIARVLADDLQRRVVVIDTSNEIAGDGDIPHPAIGRARRMQVARPELQHQVMIEAVENHMPEVIVIDEIGTELEAQAARTIAERGVMLVATAHGNELANLIRNPTLSDLVGGIQSVTLGDEEARRRRTQKTVLERAAEPTFPLAVEMHSRHRWLVHRDVAGTVDLLLRGQPTHPQARELGSDGRLMLRDDGPARPAPPPAWATAVAPRRPGPAPLAVLPLPDPVEPRPAVVSAAPAVPALRVFGVGLAAEQLEEAVRRRQLPVQVVEEPEQADAVLSVRGQLGLDPELRRQARDLGLPILVIKSDTPHQLQRAMERLLERRQGAGGAVDGDDPVGVGAARPDDAHAALEECRLAVEQVVLPQGRPVELLPRNEAVRALQAELVHHYRLRSAVFGRGRQQRLRVFPA